MTLEKDHGGASLFKFGERKVSLVVFILAVMAMVGLVHTQNKQIEQIYDQKLADHNRSMINQYTLVGNCVSSTQKDACLKSYLSDLQNKIETQILTDERNSSIPNKFIEQYEITKSNLLKLFSDQDAINN